MQGGSGWQEKPKIVVFTKGVLAWSRSRSWQKISTLFLNIEKHEQHVGVDIPVPEQMPIPTYARKYVDTLYTASQLFTSLKCVALMKNHDCI